MSKKFRDPLQDIRVSKVFRQQVVPVKREVVGLINMHTLCPQCLWELDDCDCADEGGFYPW